MGENHIFKTMPVPGQRIDASAIALYINNYICNSEISLERLSLEPIYDGDAEKFEILFPVLLISFRLCYSAGLSVQSTVL
jgi:hypothetical protein